MYITVLVLPKKKQKYFLILKFLAYIYIFILRGVVAGTLKGAIGAAWREEGQQCRERKVETGEWRFLKGHQSMASTERKNKNKK